MPVRSTGSGGGLLVTGQTTQYSSELDDGYYEKGTAKRYEVLTTGGYSGTTNVDLTHLSSSAVSFSNALSAIACTGAMGVFKAAGGETIVISGAGEAGNNGVFTTASADANTVVVTGTLTDEATGAAVVIAKREAHSNNVVRDLNKGRDWSRYVSDKMGTAGDGKMPWTGVVYDVFAYCAAANTAALAGYSDWRVANINELWLLANCGTNPQVPDATAFPSFPATLIIRSSTTDGSATTNDLGVYYTGPDIYSSSKTATAQVTLLVRGG